MKSAQELEKRAQEIINDENQTKWESGELGQSDEHAEVSVQTSIRLPAALIASLRTIAGDQGLPYQTYVKSVLHLHVKDIIKKAR